MGSAAMRAEMMAWSDKLVSPGRVIYKECFTSSGLIDGMGLNSDGELIERSSAYLTLLLSR
jgi:hypothetical protein